MKKLSLILIVLLASLLASQFALAAGGAGDHHGVPKMAVLFQALNFGMFFLLLFFLLKGKVKDAFKNRETDFKAAKIKAEQLLAEAQSQKAEAEKKLKELEDTAASTIQNAKAEAEKLKASILAEANELSQRIKAEAEKSADFEVRRAKESLRKQLLEEAVKATREAISKNLSEADQKRLQGEFVNKIEAVR